MKKKLISVLLSGAMAMGLLAGCGSSTEGTTGTNSTATVTETKTSDKADSQEVEKIKVYLPTSGKFDDLDNVMAAVNEITTKEIGVEVEFHPYEFGQWFQQYSLFLSGTEDVDILANYGGYLNAVSQGAAYDLTDLIQQYGQDIIAMEGDFLKSGEVNGTQYAIPIYASYAWTMGILYRQDVVDELGIQDLVDNVKTLEDWGEVLAVVKEKKPEMTPYVRNNGSTATNFQYGTWDDLGNNYGVLMDGGKTSDVVNLFETDEYAKLCSVMHDWYLAGYTSKDIQTQTDGFPTLTRNDAAFSTLGQADFNTSFYQSTTCGKDIGTVMISTPAARTYNNVTYTIMSNSKHAEAAMKFLNFWFSNEEVGTLIAYGIEGTHYKLDANGMGDYVDGQDSASCTYHLGSGISNTNRIRWNTEDPDYSKLLIDSNNSAQKSAALGFAFDTSSVENEITQLDNVCSKYQIGLECGALDPETALAEFNEELKSAGIETVIAEKQRQLNEFLGK
ncbi:MAG: extracellular solute-binding protein [Butyrivibrio sp.]|nr:extracellular solute-binding protein [Butyrivibrio sp.]